MKFAFMYAGLLLWLPVPVWASSIDQFPEISNPESAPCYLKTTDGRGFDLSRICGRSEAIQRQLNQIPATASNSPIPDSSFRATIDNSLSNRPGSPFGSNPSSAQCYIVDLEGNACQP
jgi:hypothetical protein